MQDALWVCKPFNGGAGTVGNGSMVALWARNWAAVEGFHAAALANGGTSEGAPGLRLLYNPDFYAAYVRDPDGNKIAVVCRGFTSAAGAVRKTRRPHRRVRLNARSSRRPRRTRGRAGVSIRQNCSRTRQHHEIHSHSA